VSADRAIDDEPTTIALRRRQRRDRARMLQCVSRAPGQMPGGRGSPVSADRPRLAKAQPIIL
jgi:hypothetical protein